MLRGFCCRRHCCRCRYHRRRRRRCCCPCRSELFSYTSCVSYAVLTSLISLDRVALKKRVVDSPEIRSVIGHVPELETCLNALYDCKYKEFFRVGWLGCVESEGPVATAAGGGRAALQVACARVLLPRQLRTMKQWQATAAPPSQQLARASPYCAVACPVPLNPSAGVPGCD